MVVCCGLFCLVLIEGCLMYFERFEDECFDCVGKRVIDGVGDDEFGEGYVMV